MDPLLIILILLIIFALVGSFTINAWLLVLVIVLVVVALFGGARRW